MSVQSCLNRLNDIDCVVYDSYKYVLNESYKFDTKVDVMCKYERDLDIVHELCGLHESYEYDYINEHNDLMQSINEYNTEYIQEGFGQKVKDFFKKVLEILKKFFSFIGRMLKALFDKLFRRKVKKTADQVAEECITGSHVKEYMESGDGDADKSVKVHFPASPDSVIKECDLELITKSLLIKIENNNYVIGLAPGFEGTNFDDLKGNQHTFATAKAVSDPEYQTFMFLHFVDNIDNYRTILTEYIDWFINNQNRTISENELHNMDIIADQLNKMSHVYGNTFKHYSWSPKLLLHSQKIINDIANKANKINTIPDGQDKRYVKLLNELIDTITAITVGCNQYSRNVKAMYLIDKKYMHTINDIGILAKFVSSLIDANIPSAQVAYNTWCVMDPKFDDRGFYLHHDVNENMIQPRWGQTRVTFFPIKKPNEVIKISLNSTGILGNKREHQIYKQYKKHGNENLLAEPITQYENYTISIMERLVCDKERAKNVVPAIKNIMDSLEDNLHHINDIHAGNIGHMPDDVNTWKIIDYAG